MCVHVLGRFKRLQVFAAYMTNCPSPCCRYQESFHGVNLCSLRNTAVSEYFKQPIVVSCFISDLFNANSEELRLVMEDVMTVAGYSSEQIKQINHAVVRAPLSVNAEEDMTKGTAP